MPSASLLSSTNKSEELFLVEDEDRATVEGYIKELRTLIIEDEGLSHLRTDSPYLLRFLRVAKYDLKKALKNMKKFYKMKKHAPDMFISTRPEDAKDVLLANYFVELPDQDPQGRKIIAIRFGAWDTEAFTIYEVLRSLLLAFEYSLQDPVSQTKGLVFAVDVNGMGWKHIRAFPISAISFCANVIQDSFPGRIKAMHFINEPFVFSILLSLARPFLKSKILRRLHLHGTKFEEFHEAIPKEILPEEFGGNTGPLDGGSYFREICEDKEIRECVIPESRNASSSSNST